MYKDCVITCQATWSDYVGKIAAEKQEDLKQACGDGLFTPSPLLHYNKFSFCRRSRWRRYGKDGGSTDDGRCRSARAAVRFREIVVRITFLRFTHL